MNPLIGGSIKTRIQNGRILLKNNSNRSKPERPVSLSPSTRTCSDQPTFHVGHGLLGISTWRYPPSTAGRLRPEELVDDLLLVKDSVGHGATLFSIRKRILSDCMVYFDTPSLYRRNMLPRSIRPQSTTMADYIEDPTGHLMRWHLRLSPFYFYIVYRPGLNTKSQRQFPILPAPQGPNTPSTTMKSRPSKNHCSW